MKIHFLIFILFIPYANAYSQSREQTTCDSIDCQEAVLLNSLASKYGLNYDFSYKKVAFYSGPGGGARKLKDDFISICRNIDDKYSPTSPFAPRIYIFDETEKVRADGYDAVIVYGSVKQFPTKKTLIRRLHRFKMFN